MKKKKDDREKPLEIIKVKEDRIKKFELPEIFLFNPENRPAKYRGADLKSIKAMVREAQNFEKAVIGKTYWYIGQALYYVLEKKLYEEDGFDNFYDFAKAELNYQSSSMVNRVLKVYYAFSSEEAKRIPGSLLVLSAPHVNYVNITKMQIRSKDPEKLIQNREIIFNFFNERLDEGDPPSYREFQSFLKEHIIEKTSKKIGRRRPGKDRYEADGFELFIDSTKASKPVHLFEDKILNINFEKLRDEGVSNKVISQLENEIMDVLEKYQVIDN